MVGCDWLLAACVLVFQCRTWARLQSWSGSIQTSLAWSHWVRVGEACWPGGGTCQHRHTLDSDTSLSFSMSPSSSSSLSVSNSGGIVGGGASGEVVGGGVKWAGVRSRLGGGRANRSSIAFEKRSFSTPTL